MNLFKTPDQKDLILHEEALKEMYLRMIAYTSIPFNINPNSLTQLREIIRHIYLFMENSVQYKVRTCSEHEESIERYKKSYMELSVSYKKIFKRSLRIFHDNQLNNAFEGNLKIWDNNLNKRIRACLNTYGEVVFKESLNRAIEGDIKAQIDLGKYYFLGWGTNVSTKEGIYWLKKAAQSNNSKALLNLGTAMELMSYQQIGIRICEDVEKLYARAYAIGEGVAAYYLFRYFDQFTVGKTGKIKAKKWLEKGLEIGDPYCLFEAERGLDPDQKWLPGHIENLMDWLQKASNMSLPGCLEVLSLLYFKSDIEDKEE